jgi:two-component system, LytTR family, response regulator
MINAIIIDDETGGINTLRSMLTLYAPDVCVLACTTDPEEGARLIAESAPDVVFLDICMPGMDGFEVLQSLNERAFALVFTTGMLDRGLQAIRAEAVGYLVKPLDIDELRDVMRKIRNRMEESRALTGMIHALSSRGICPPLRVQLPTRDDIRYVASYDIIYIEADSNCANVALTGQTKIHVNRPLKEYEHLLCYRNSGFIRLHNSFIINTQHVTRYVKEDGGYVVMEGSRTIPISRHRREEIIHALRLPV